ncbi:MAG: DUF1015 family protein [Actinomycetota bacterium]|nr:DUF1015 family protein [Actinomycetota bacterium]
MHRFMPLASYRYDTTIVGPEKLASPPVLPVLGELVRDKDIGFYLYQMVFRDLSGNLRQFEGVFGILELSHSDHHSPDFYANNVDPSSSDHLLAHEHTIASGTEMTSDDFNSTISRPGTGPVWGISIQNLIKADTIKRGQSLSSVIDGSGTTHKIWQITAKEDQLRIKSAVGHSQLIIADGHHRIARAYKRLAMAHTGNTVRLPCFVTDFDSLQAEIRPIHRCFKTQLENDEVMTRLQQNFNVKRYGNTSDTSFHDAHALVVLFRKSAFTVNQFDGDKQTNDAVLSQTIAKVVGARSTQYFTDIEKLRERVNSDPTKIGLVNRPLTLDQIRLAALSKSPLPPKSTMFYPKPLPGLIFGDRLHL